MQVLTNDELYGFRNEFEMTCAAQDGNGKAWMALWNHYKPLMMSRLVKVRGISFDELESEAVDVFTHKLEIFNREKVSSEESYSMFSWLYFGVINRTAKLIRRRRKEINLYFESVSAACDSSGVCELPPACGSDDEKTDPWQKLAGIENPIYFIYSPEKLVVENTRESDTERVKTFYAKLSQLDKDILEARRKGMTLAQVAERFRCSTTTVKNRIRRAKQYAGDVFEVNYA